MLHLLWFLWENWSGLGAQSIFILIKAALCIFWYLLNQKQLDLEMFSRIKCMYRHVNPSGNPSIQREISDDSNWDCIAITVCSHQKRIKLQRCFGHSRNIAANISVRYCCSSSSWHTIRTLDFADAFKGAVLLVQTAISKSELASIAPILQ